MEEIKKQSGVNYSSLQSMCEKIATRKSECSMHSFPLGDYGATALACKILHSRHLESLNLGFCKIGQSGIVQLVIGLRHCTSLRELILGERKKVMVQVGCFLPEAADCVQKGAILGAVALGAPHVVNFFKKKPIKAPHPGLLAVDVAVGVIATAIKHLAPKTKDISVDSDLLSANNLGDQGTEAIADLLLYVDLERLDLSYCNVSIKPMSYFREIDNSRRTLKWLSLKGNPEINSSNCKFRGRSSLKVEY